MFNFAGLARRLADGSRIAQSKALRPWIRGHRFAELRSELVTFFEFLVALESPGAFFALLGAGGRN